MGMACHDPRASHTAPTGRDAQGDEGDHPVGQRLAAALPELCPSSMQVCKDMPWSLAVRCSTQINRHGPTAKFGLVPRRLSTRR